MMPLVSAAPGRARTTLARLTRLARWTRWIVCGGLCAMVSACTGTNAGLITVSGPSNVATSLVVKLSSHDGLHTSRFTVPMVAAGPLTLPKTIAVTFPSTVGGYLDVHVDGIMGGNVVAVGDGFSTTPVVKGGVTQMAVELIATGQAAPLDGGVDAGGAAMDLTTRD